MTTCVYKWRRCARRRFSYFIYIYKKIFYMTKNRCQLHFFNCSAVCFSLLLAIIAFLIRHRSASFQEICVFTGLRATRLRIGLLRRRRSLPRARNIFDKPTDTKMRVQRSFYTYTIRYKKVVKKLQNYFINCFSFF